MEGDEDEEDLDDIEHEFKMEEEQSKKQQQPLLNKHITEAMLYGKMSYGRGPEDEENNKFPPIITGSLSRPVKLKLFLYNSYSSHLNVI